MMVEGKAIVYHVDVLSGFAFASNCFSDQPGTGIPLIRIRDLLEHQSETFFTGAYNPEYIIQAGDILIGMDGDFNVVRWRGDKALLNQRVCKVTSVSSELHEGYLYHWLQPKLSKIHQQTPQTTVRHLSVKDIEKIEIPFWPLPEQRRIAEILDAADEAIRQTALVIAKLRQVKAGLLHDLLTRGLDAQGRLRDPDAHPEQFKGSPLGSIPREWEIKQLDSLIEPSSFVTYGVVKPGPEDSDGVLFVRGGDFPDGQILTEQLRTITQQVSAQYQRTILQGGEILVSLVGQPGACAVVPSSLAGANIARQAALIRLQSNISAYFVKAFISSEKGQQMLVGDTLGSVQQVINLRDLRQLLIPVPLQLEQNGIVETLDTADARIRAEEATLAKLRQVKRGLMDDLLTGRVRV